MSTHFLSFIVENMLLEFMVCLFFFQEVSEATEVDWNAEAHFFINLIF